MLRAPQMLEDLPGRVGEPLGDDAAQGGGDALHRRVEAGVGILPVEELLQVRAQRLIVVHAR